MGRRVKIACDVTVIFIFIIHLKSEMLLSVMVHALYVVVHVFSRCQLYNILLGLHGILRLL